MRKKQIKSVSFEEEKPLKIGFFVCVNGQSSVIAERDEGLKGSQKYRLFDSVERIGLGVLAIPFFVGKEVSMWFGRNKNEILLIMPLDYVSNSIKLERISYEELRQYMGI